MATPAVLTNAWRLCADKLDMVPFSDGTIVFDRRTGQTHQVAPAHSELLAELSLGSPRDASMLAQALFGSHDDNDLNQIRHAMGELEKLGFVESIVAPTVFP